MRLFNNYQRCLSYLYSFIPPKRLLHTGESGILRTKYLLHLLGDPQEKIRVIHVAGTSGKGSTAYLTSLLLKAHGFKTGLQVSPHLLDIRERFQINNELISKEQFTQFVAGIMPYVEKAKETNWGKLTFFEIGVCLAFYIFQKETVDFCVMETGLGGMYDGTNVVESPHKLVLLTGIGLDHQSVLGRTLSAIATQKAGIIRKGNTVITVQQNRTVMNVFNSVVKDRSATLIVNKKGKQYRHISVSKSGTDFDYAFESLELPRLRLGLIGKHQAENAAISLTALSALSRRYRLLLKKGVIYSALRQAYFKGRMEIHHIHQRDLIIDGAHNPQKMKAFITTLINLYPKQKFDFLIAFSEGKNQIPVMREMLKIIVPKANSIVLTDFILEGDDVLHHSVPKERIMPIFGQLNFKNYSFQKFDTVMMSRLLEKNERPLVITGSLYLIGSMYKELKKYF